MNFSFGTFSKEQLIIVGVVFVVVLFFVLGFIGIIPLFPKDSGDPNLPDSAKLVAWGLKEDTEAFKDLASAYKGSSEETKNIEISFVGFNSGEELEKTLINSLAENNGPDIFYFHNSWMIKHGAKTQPAYSVLIDPVSIAKIFPQTVKEDFIASTNSGTFVYALPIYLDALGVIINKDILQASGVTFDETKLENLTWEDFKEIVQKTKDIKNAKIIRAGTSMGTSQNIPNSSDIISALLLQSGSTLKDANGRVRFDEDSRNAFLFYLQFANRSSDVFTWDNSFLNSRDEFLKNNVAMIVDYYSEFQKIMAKNKFMNIQIIPLPQISATASKKRTLSSYWGLAVSNFSKNKYAAWHFIKFATTNEGANKSFLDKTGKLPALSSLISKGSTGDSEAFLKSFLFSRSWSQKNPAVTKAALDALVENVNSNRLSINQAIKSAEDTINE